jgi:hypothetical protein
MLFNDDHGQLYFFTGIFFAVNNKEMIDKFIYVCGTKEHDNDKLIGGGQNKITGNKLNLQATQPCCAQINRCIYFTQRKIAQ